MGFGQRVGPRVGLGVGLDCAGFHVVSYFMDGSCLGLLCSDEVILSPTPGGIWFVCLFEVLILFS